MDALRQEPVADDLFHLWRATTTTRLAHGLADPRQQALRRHVAKAVRVCNHPQRSAKLLVPVQVRGPGPVPHDFSDATLVEATQAPCVLHLVQAFAEGPPVLLVEQRVH